MRLGAEITRCKYGKWIRKTNGLAWTQGSSMTFKDEDNIHDDDDDDDTKKDEKDGGKLSLCLV